ncbi:MAG: YfhD-like protein [Bacilli bacterium]|nr:YfhD-like protein [Bacilli bacterium]
MNNQSQEKSRNQSQKENLPVAVNEDVEFSAEQADSQDVEAQARANAADQRQQTNQNNQSNQSNR